MSKKKRRRARTPRESGALTKVSIEALQAELQRRRRAATPLLKRRARLAEKLAAMDARIASLGLSVEEAAPSRRGRGRPASASVQASRGRPRGTRRRGDQGLRDILQKVLTGRTLGVREAADEVLKAGYRTGSKNFRTVINQTLLVNKDRFRKVSRGKYTAK